MFSLTWTTTHGYFQKGILWLVSTAPYREGFWPREFEQAMGEKADYVIHDGFWSSLNGAPMSAELQERFIKEFNRDSVSVGLSYANPQILAMIIPFLEICSNSLP